MDLFWTLLIGVVIALAALQAIANRGAAAARDEKKRAKLVDEVVELRTEVDELRARVEELEDQVAGMADRNR
jgi:uncharacterized protein YlxW (UPF0749 family)